MLHGVHFSVVVSKTRDSGDMAVAVTARAFYVVAVGGGAFGCSGTPCGLVACAGDAIVGICAWSCATNVVGNGTVSHSGPRLSGVGSVCALRPASLLG